MLLEVSQILLKLLQDRGTGTDTSLQQSQISAASDLAQVLK